MKTLDFKLYDKLIEAAYGTALDDGRWSALFDLMREATGVEHFVVQGFDLSLSSKSIAELYGYDQVFAESYDAYYWQKNPWLPGIAASPVGRSVAAELYCSESELRRSEFYNDLIVTADDIGTGGGVVLFRDESRFLSIGGNIKLKHRDALQSNWLDLLNLLAPHLQNAFELRRKLSGRQLVDRGYLSALDAIGNAVFLLTRRGRVAHANPAAETLLAARGFVMIDPSRSLRFTDPEADGKLSAAVGLIASGLAPTNTRQIRLRSAEIGHQALATLSPFCPDPAQSDPFADFAVGDVPVAILTIVDTKTGNGPTSEILTQLYHLTRAESALAIALSEGKSLKEYAEEKSVSRHTVRNQLRAVFSKTDTKRQGELVALLAKYAK